MAARYLAGYIQSSRHVVKRPSGEARPKEMEKRSNIEEEEIQTIIPTWGLCCNTQKEAARSLFFLFLTKKENQVHPHRSQHTQR